MDSNPICEALIPTPKTCREEQYLKHICSSIGNFGRLYAHYKQERWSRWKVYQHEQKALHEFCMRVKGDENRQAKREEVVVAYGGAQFRPSMKGKRAAPVKKFRKHLSR